MATLQFLGAARQVGKSCISLTTNNTTAFLDCGLKMQEVRSTFDLPNFKQARTPNAIIISHSHLDHVGAAPALVKQTSSKVFTTKPTVEVSNILLQDVLKVAE